MGEPVKQLRNAGNGKSNGQVAEQPGAESQGFLLQACVEPGGECNVGSFNDNNREAATKASACHCRQIYEGAGGCAEQGALPIPAGESLSEKSGAAGWLHDIIVKQCPPMQRQQAVTGGFRSIEDRNREDSPAGTVRAQSVIQVTVMEREAR
jgi:hypothetical protein